MVKKGTKPKKKAKKKMTTAHPRKARGKAVSRTRPAVIAKDIMMRKVVTVGPDAQVRDVAKLLVEKGISGVPVVSAGGELLGIVSEGDLMRRSEIETDRSRSWWLRFFAAADDLAAEFVKSHALKVADVMTRDVISVGPDTPLRDIATILEKHRIKRVPIMRRGKLIGIVSRANLVQTLASLPSATSRPRSRSDESVRRVIDDNLSRSPWGRSVINAVVQNGTVDLWGFVDSDEEKKAARVLVETTPGVRVVNDHVTVRKFIAAD